jgi:fimbrial chaperone protein
LQAYTVEPGLLVLGSTGGDSSGYLRLANRSTRPTAVEIVVNEFGRDLDGRAMLGRRADDQFIIYPAQIVLMPGDEAGIQVRWIGEPAGSERAFALTTKEVPIPRRDGETADAPSEGARIDINVLVNYDVRVYVKPRGARPRIAVESVNAQPRQSLPDLLEITLANRGNAHQSLREMSLVLTPLGTDGEPSGQPQVRMSAQDVPGMGPALLPGDRRRLLLPRPADLPPGGVRAVLSE